VRDQRLDFEVVIVDVVTSVELATDVVVVEDADELVVSDVRVSGDEGTSVVAVVAVEPVDIIKDVKDNASVVPVEEAIVIGTEVIAADVVVIVGNVVRVELSIGLNLTALAAVIFEIIPPIAKERMSVNTIRMGTDFT
jgi:hypothetical protein